MHGSWLIGAFLLSAAASAPAIAAEPGPLLGFSPASSQAEQALESRFDANLSLEAIRARLKDMSSQPNHVGSPHDKANAEASLAWFKSWGWDARIEVFDVLYPTPIAETLELTGPAPYAASLKEPPVPGDASSNVTGGLPPYVAYAADGDVAAPLVYVNYGMPDDYRTLERMGVDVKGKIVIARYGGGWRGLKPKLAYEHGAVGCIIYSDPADDGYGQGDVWPKGAWRNENGVQRGSVLDIPIESGDPLTPDIGATKDAKRLPLSEARGIMKIPTLPISYGDAQHFLAAIEGEAAPRRWRGQLPIVYKVGQSGAPVHLMVKSDWSLKPLYDVIAVMRGREQPDEWVVRGNHRDGWVMGAFDPLAGNSSMLEEAKSLGLLARTGWKPRRTIVYASWDGEEPGLLGSTEWAEAHDAELKAKAVLYVNTDTNGRGVFRSEASYSAQKLVDQVASDVKDPETGASVGARARAAIAVAALTPDATDEVKRQAREMAAGGDLVIGDLGSGSDYTPFVQHLGIASINFDFDSEAEQYGVYHSLYDDFEHYERYGDPAGTYGVAMSRMAGRMVLRAADAEVVPLQFGDLAKGVAGKVEELHKLADTARQHRETLDKALDAGAFPLAADPMHKSVAPEREDVVPAIAFAPLDAAVARLKASAAAYDTAAVDAASLKPERRAELDGLLQSVEQTLTDPRGLPGRPWYKHLIYAPGVLTGYGAKTIPGVREAIEGRRWSEADEYAARTALALNACSDRLDKATALLKP
ncbi:MAG TPA: transferrin receptor-like dimerization domain-containing protein [Caulobacteraceae bacterium]|jgi:N-acetylated-alpha-linked acidic dipeptidase|nr:transferrin receptor-like dimerization domain-containing protein [Caulobacteraceae bacterium]